MPAFYCILHRVSDTTSMGSAHDHFSMLKRSPCDAPTKLAVNWWSVLPGWTDSASATWQGRPQTDLRRRSPRTYPGRGQAHARSATGWYGTVVLNDIASRLTPCFLWACSCQNLYNWLGIACGRLSLGGRSPALFVHCAGVRQTSLQTMQCHDSGSVSLGHRSGLATSAFFHDRSGVQPYSPRGLFFVLKPLYTPVILFFVTGMANRAFPLSIVAI
jgi:hypothetical protein